MPTCFVPGCGTRNGFNKKIHGPNTVDIKCKKLSVFTAHDKEMADKWNEAIGTSNKRLTQKCFVCELHFRKEEVEAEFVVALDKGRTFCLGRERKRLKPGSIPSIFSYWTKVNLATIRKPSDFWYGPNVIGDKICFGSLSKQSGITDKRVVFMFFRVNVYIAQVPVKLDFLKRSNYQTNLEIEYVLREVEKLLVCSGVSDQKRAKDCLGYINSSTNININDNQVCENCEYQIKSEPALKRGKSTMTDPLAVARC